MTHGRNTFTSDDRAKRPMMRAGWLPCVPLSHDWTVSTSAKVVRVFQVITDAGPGCARLARGSVRLWPDWEEV